MVVVFTIVTVVMFFMLIWMQMDMVVHVMPAVGAMVDDHRCGPNFTDRKNRHAEDHEKSKTPHQGILSTSHPGVGMVAVMSRMFHE